MCGIVGYIGDKEVKEVLLSGLQKLEYRGYDSAGLAVLQDKDTKIIRSLGKLKELAKVIYRDETVGHIGIGHTRWATHGKPSVENAHPHKAGTVTIVHNGIIENYQEIKELLGEEVKNIKSETDTEVAAHLIARYTSEGMSTMGALFEAANQLRGSYAIVVLDEREPDTLFVAKKGSPLIVAPGDQESYIASDIQAILNYARDYYVLEDDEFAEVTRGEVKLFDKERRPIKRELSHASWDAQEAEKGGFRHFMLKEIHEQPVAITNTIKDRISPDLNRVVLPELDDVRQYMKGCDRIYVIACGTAYHAGFVAKYFLEEHIDISVEVDLASEFRYRKNIFTKNSMAIFVSQSGETADTLAACKKVKEQGIPTISICNVRESSLARETDAVFYTSAGPEIGVASTKAFSCQVAAFYIIMLDYAKAKGVMDQAEIREHIGELIKIPYLMNAVLSRADDIKDVARDCKNFKDVMFIGRNLQYPMALEAALKLKEISYLHAEGYAGGELKHGPIAIIDESVLLVALIQDDELAEKTISNMLEVKARDAAIMALSNADIDRHHDDIDFFVKLPKCIPSLAPFLFVIPLQLFAYHIAEQMGLDIDKPRNLAKSVTVE